MSDQDSSPPRSGNTVKEAIKISDDSDSELDDDGLSAEVVKDGVTMYCKKPIGSRLELCKSQAKDNAARNRRRKKLNRIVNEQVVQQQEMGTPMDVDISTAKIEPLPIEKTGEDVDSDNELMFFPPRKQSGKRRGDGVAPSSKRHQTGGELLSVSNMQNHMQAPNSVVDNTNMTTVLARLVNPMVVNADSMQERQASRPKNVTAPAMTMQPAISHKVNGRVLSGGLPILKPPKWRIGQSPELLHEILREHGVAVVPNVVSKEQADEFERQFKGVLSTCNPLWDKDKTCAPSPGSRGCSLLKWHGLATAACTQRMRCDKGTLAAFAALYNCDVDHLVTSIDCVACSQVHSTEKPKGEGVYKSLLKSSLPPHQDETKDGESQNLKRKLEAIPGAFPGCVQGSLVLQAQEAKQIGNKWYAPPSFVAMPGKQPEIPDGNKDYAPPNMDPKEVNKRLCYIEAPSCSMILWTSNTVHTNYGGDAKFFEDKGDFDFARLAIMVCAVPRVCSSDDTTAKKKALFGIRDTSNPKLKLPKHGASTSHYPHVVKPCGPGHMSNKKEGDHRHWKTHKGFLTEEQARHI